MMSNQRLDYRVETPTEKETTVMELNMCAEKLEEIMDKSDLEFELLPKATHLLYSLLQSLQETPHQDEYPRMLNSGYEDGRRTVKRNRNHRMRMHHNDIDDDRHPHEDLDSYHREYWDYSRSMNKAGDLIAPDYDNMRKHKYLAQQKFISQQKQSEENFRKKLSPSTLQNTSAWTMMDKFEINEKRGPKTLKKVEERKPEKNLKSGQTFITDLHFHHVCGVGRISLVYVCTHKYSGEVCCIKQLKRSVVWEGKHLEQVQNEKNILYSMQHEGIVKLYNTCNDLLNLYFICEYIPGGSLQFYLKKFKKFDEKMVIFYAAEMISILDYLFRRKIVYRNITSENILLDERGHIKLIAFGNAKTLEVDQEKTSTVIGQLDYLSPEVITGGGYNFVADWWSFGVLLYEMLTGTMPFAHSNVEQLFELICEGKVEFPPNLSPNSVNFIKQLLTVNPQLRLSCIHGRQKVTSQPWFSEVQWANIENRTETTPLIPILNSKIDTSNCTPEENFENIQKWQLSMNVQIPNHVQSFFDSF